MSAPGQAPTGEAQIGEAQIGEAKITEDGWLAGLMGRPVFRVDLAGPQSDQAAEERLREHSRQQARAFYYTKVDAARVDTARRLSAGGFFVADTNVLFQLDRSPQLTLDFPGVTVGGLEAGEEEAVLEIAAGAYRFTRFHLDPFVGVELANAIKRAWCGNYVRRLRGDRLFVARLEGRPAGFLAALTVEAPGQRKAIIDLIGVAPAFQRRRVGAALTTAFVEHYRGRAALLQVGTQVANLPSIRLYERCGFSLASSQYVLHLHIEAGKPRQ
jgi:dTDP-4-amino-4,6-dideoxy-D-galactose acyltransferase